MKDAREEEAKKKWKRTHRPCAIWKRVAHDIYVTGHKTLPSKAIRAISIDRPRQVRKVDIGTLGAKASWYKYFS